MAPHSPYRRGLAVAGVFAALVLVSLPGAALAARDSASDLDLDVRFVTTGSTITSSPFTFHVESPRGIEMTDLSLSVDVAGYTTSHAITATNKGTKDYAEPDVGLSYVVRGARCHDDHTSLCLLHAMPHLSLVWVRIFTFTGSRYGHTFSGIVRSRRVFHHVVGVQLPYGQFEHLHGCDCASAWLRYVWWE